ncbi:hypothetical protein AAV94_02465 [Lampropedia cohaerens]|uniref:Uncharacterized protein n=2 Tax=Lampropedia cohaerens TaxID=1610491 RepID=A0A0U1Q254_9BURK|nr:hypothetical protein AAV94_02465 [Lampropedia cohaerens]
MPYRLTITGDGIRPGELDAARRTYIETLRTRLGDDAAIARHFRAWERCAVALYDGASRSPADEADAKAYLAATREAEFAAAECMPDAVFLNFDFEVC